MVLLVTFLGTPAANAGDEPSMRNITTLRLDNTDQLILMNMNSVTVRFDYVDPKYGPQSMIMLPMGDSGETPMCAIGDNTSPIVYVTFNPGTPAEYTDSTSYYSTSTSTSSLEYLEQRVADARAAVVKARAAVVKARAAVAMAKLRLKKAVASHRQVWVRSASVSLAKAKAKLVRKKAVLKQRKVLLFAAKQQLESLKEDIAYCQSRLPS